MALAVPILSTRVSAIPEVVVDGETGWLVPPRDPDAIAAALREALSDPARLHACGEQGRQRLQAQFTVQAMVERTIAVYESLAGRNKN
jgi:starch synthase